MNLFSKEHLLSLNPHITVINPPDEPHQQNHRKNNRGVKSNTPRPGGGPVSALAVLQVLGSVSFCCKVRTPLSPVLVVCAGDPAAALRLSSQLISLGADVSLRSRWTNMNALHYAAYFDVPELIRVLLKASKPRGTHTISSSLSVYHYH